jgi:hypothetical protein
MDLQHETTFPASGAQVQEMLLDEGFLTRYAEGTGALRQEVSVERGSDTATSRVRRQMPTDGVPAVFRRVIGAAVEVTEVTVWQNATAEGRRQASLEADIGGMPVRFRGDSVLIASDAGSRLLVTGTVKASVPFIGAKAEELLRSAIIAALDKQAAIAADWLRERDAGAR